MAKKRALRKPKADHTIDPFGGGFMICNYWSNPERALYCGRSMRWRSQPAIEDPFPTRTEAEMAWEKYQQPESKTVPIEENPILSISEAAKQMGYHRNRVREYCEDGLIKSGTIILKSGRKITGIRQSQVDKWLDTFPI